MKCTPSSPISVEETPMPGPRHDGHADLNIPEDG
jgi:hypothetical protein